MILSHEVPFGTIAPRRLASNALGHVIMLFFLSLVLTLFVGCGVTEYQPMPPDSARGIRLPQHSGGYKDSDLGNGIHEIRVEVVNAWRELALEYFDRRKEEITKERGYSHCETLYVVGINNTAGVGHPRGAQAEGRIKCH